MSTVITVNHRGTLTIPKGIREKYGLTHQIILEETSDGLMLRPAATYPLELYTEERVAEFQRHNEEELRDYKLP
jgi:AbrB family looped-hinge helix DNA binding protein